MTPVRKLLWCLWAAALAGALGGALVGLGESTLVALTAGAAREYWLFVFGVGAYGALGVAIGVAAAVTWLVLRRGRPDSGAAGQVAIALSVGLLTFAVGRYHVAQRVFEESLVLASVAGVLTHVGLLLAAAIISAAAAYGVGLLNRGGRRFGVAALLAAAWLVALAVGLGAGDRAAPEPLRPVRSAPMDHPNIILIAVDTLRPDAIEPYGARAGTTPALAKLAADGVVFERVFAQASWTRPSIASILTSQYPSEHGGVHKFDILPDAALTLAEALRAEGYWTVGFVTNINVAPVFNFQQGFDEYFYLEPDFYFGASDSATKLAAYKGLRVARERFFSRRMYFNHYYQDAEVLGRRVTRWLEESPPRPFFLLLHYMDPHDPYLEIPYNGQGVARVMTPSPPAAQAEQIRKLYLEDVGYLDEHLGALLDRLRTLGLYDETIIALVSDHGEEFQEHGGWWHGTTLYEEALHVPLIVKRGREPLGGGRRPGLARLIDVAPSLMRAGGLRVPESFDGIDLFSGDPDEPIFAEEDLEGNRLTSVRVGDWKLITANPDNPRGLSAVELYNLQADPGERRNVADQEKDQVRRLLAQMQEIQRDMLPGKVRPGAAIGN